MRGGTGGGWGAEGGGRGWLAHAVESYLRGSTSFCDQVFLLRRGLLQVRGGTGEGRGAGRGRGQGVGGTRRRELPEGQHVIL